MGLKEDVAQHPFTFPSLNLEAGSHEQPYVRVLLFINKRPDITDEEFHVWWKTVHADLTVAFEGYEGQCSRYVQLHQTAEHRAAIEKHGLEPLPYDGFAEMHVKSLDDWMAFQKSPEFAEKLGRDAVKFVNGIPKVMVGYDNLIYGRKIEGSEGPDGLDLKKEKSKSASAAGNL